MTLKNNRAPLLFYFKLCASFHSHQWNQTGVTVRKRSIRVKIDDFFPCDLEIWQMTLKNNRAPLLCYFKLCGSFRSHSEFRLELQPGNAQFGSKSAIFLCRVTLKFNQWPWKTIGHLFYTTLYQLCASFQSYRWIWTGVTVRKRSVWSKSAIYFPWDLEIWRITLKNNRAPLLCCFKLYAIFHSHRWIQTKVTVRKRSIGVKISDLLSRVTLEFDGWPWKTIGHLLYATSSFVHHFVAIGEFKLE